MKKREKRKTYALIGLLLTSFFLAGWGNTWEDMQKEAMQITSLSTHFSQETHTQILNKPLLSKGHFYFQAPDAVRWEYTSPVKSVLLMRKGSIARYTLGDKGLVKDTGTTTESMRFVLQEISRWSKGQFTENEFFSATLKGGKERQIILTPKEKEFSAMISRIVIKLSDRPGVFKSVKIVENEGNYTLLEFTDVLVNEKISATLFREVP